MLFLPDPIDKLSPVEMFGNIVRLRCTQLNPRIKWRFSEATRESPVFFFQWCVSLFLKYRDIPYMCVYIYVRKVRYGTVRYGTHVCMCLINHPNEILFILQQPWFSGLLHFDLNGDPLKTPSTRPRCQSPSGSLKRRRSFFSRVKAVGQSFFKFHFSIFFFGGYNHCIS
jgi:hypothetical protein